MADNSVFITGVADGAFEKALGELPPWATEHTTLTIEEILRKTLKLQTDTFKELVKSASGSGGLSPEGVKKFNDSLDNASKLLEEDRKQHPKDKKFWKDSEDEHDKLRRRWKELAAEHPRLIGALAMIAAAGVRIEKTFVDNVNTFDKLNAAGINTVAGLAGASSGFQGLQQITALTGVRFTELASSMVQFNTAVNAFGAGKFAKTIGMSVKGLAEFGFSSKEAADLLGEYLTMQQGLGDISQRTTTETSEDLKRFANNINRLSLATGQQRSEIMKNIATLSKSVDANVLQGQTGTAAASSTLEFIASIKDVQFGKTLLKMMTDQIKPLNQTFTSFQKIGQGGFAQKMMAFTQSLKGMDPESARQATRVFEEQNRAQIEYGKKQANFYSQIPELAGDAQKALEVYNGLQQTSRETVKVSEEDLAKLKETNKARAGLATAWEKLLSTLQRAFAPTTGMLNMLTKGLEAVNWAIDGLLSIIPDGMLSWAGAIAVVVSAVAGISALAGPLGLFSKALGFLTAKMFGFGKGAQAGKAGKAAEWTTSLGADGSGGLSRKSKSGGDLIGKIGKGMGDIGRGLGKGVKGFLVGLADGLKALASPKVLIGVAALAGISAALWITSKAMKEFNTIEWESLAKAGVALVGLTIAVAGLGAIMSTGAGALAILAGAAALALMGASLWVLGAGIQAIGSGFDSLSKGINSLGEINGMQILGITGAIMGLGIGLSIATPFLIAGSIGLIALGVASMLAGPGLALLAWGLKGLSEISGTQIAGIALGLGALALSILAVSPALIIAAIPLAAFGIAAAIAAVPIALLAWGLKSLLEISAGDLLKVAGSLAVFGLALTLAGPLLIAGSVGLIAIGVAALIATPGLLGISLAFKMMSEAISTLSGVGFAGLVGVGTGIAIMSVALAVALPFMLIASAGLLALGAAALIATPGIIGVGYGLKLMGEGMQAFAGIGFTDMLGVAGGLIALGVAAGLASVGLLLGAPGLLLFGVAALVAGPGIKSLAEGLAILEPLTGANLPKLAAGIDALTSAGKIGLMAFGLAALTAAPGIKALAEGLTPLAAIEGYNLFAVAIGIDIISKVSTLGLLALGYAGDKAGEGIKLLAAGLVPLSEIDGSNLISAARGIKALTSISATALLAFSLAALTAAPGIYALTSGLELLGNLDSDSLVGAALGITELTNISAIALLAFGMAAGVAGIGIGILGASLSIMAPALESSASSLVSVSTGIETLSDVLNNFTGLDTLKSIVGTINEIDTVKALALGALSAMNAVSLPAPTQTSGPSASTSPIPSTIDSPSVVSTNTVAGEQATVKETPKGNSAEIEKPNSNDGINTTLNYQSTLLEQMVLGLGKVLDVNKDILKYARVQA